MACLRHTDSDMQALEKNVQEMIAAARAGDLKLRVQYSVDFHRILARTARNPVLAIMTNVLVDLTMGFVRALGVMPNEFVIESRLRMLQHLRARDLDNTVQEYTDYMQKTLRNYLQGTLLGTGELIQTASGPPSSTTPDTQRVPPS